MKAPAAVAPWFSVELSTHTTDRIEVRICGDEGTNNEDVPIEQLEIYVQSDTMTVQCAPSMSHMM